MAQLTKTDYDLETASLFPTNGVGDITAADLRAHFLNTSDSFPFKVTGKTTAPAANDDDANTSGNGYFSIGDVWVDETNDAIFVCVDNSTNAAIWVISGAATGANIISAGVPVADQIAVWTTVNSVRGDSNLTWDGTTFTVTGDVVFGGTSSLQLPSGTTAQRPGSPVDGMIRYNTSLLTLEVYDNASWVDILAAGPSGDISKVGTPVDNQIGVWTGDGTIEGDADFTWDGTALSVTGNITVTGTVDGRDIATDGTKLDGIEAGAERSTPAIISVASSRALALTDERDILEVDTTGGAVVVTIPTNAAVAFPIGTIINITLVDITAAASITADTGVTLNGVSTGTGVITAELFAGVSLYKRSADAWVAQGKIGTVA